MPSRQPSKPDSKSPASFRGMESLLKNAGKAFMRLEKGLPGMFYVHSVKPDGSQQLPFVSQGCRTLFGLNPRDVAREPKLLFETIHPDDRERRDSSIKKMVATRQPGRELLRHIVRGEARWYDCMAIPELQRNGDTFLYGFVFEVTDRKRIENALGVSERKLALAFQAIPDGFSILRLDDGMYIEANAGESKITGYSHEELIGKTTLELKVYAEPEDRKRLVKEFIQQGIVRNFEFQFRKKSGELRWDRVSGGLTDIGGATCIIRQFSDITVQKQAQQELKLSEERLRLALHAAGQGLYDLDIPSGLASYSIEYAAMLGYEWPGFNLSIDSWIELMHPDDRKPTLRTYHEYLKGERPEYSVEFRMRTKSGEWKWILSKGRIVSWDAEGKPVRMLGTHTDITPQKKFEAELTRQKVLRDEKAAQLESANQALMAALQHRDAEKRAIEETLFQNLKKLIFPNVVALSACKLPPKVMAHVRALQNNLETAIDSSPLASAIRYRDLTPKELQVAEFIRQGLSTKEIAEFLGISPGSVSFHRNSIREKLRLKNKKTNLKRFLSEMP